MFLERFSRTNRRCLQGLLQWTEFHLNRNNSVR